MAPRGPRNSNRSPLWRRDSPFYSEINSLDIAELLSVPAQDNQSLNAAVDQWERLDPVVKDYLNARMQFQMISAFNLLRQRLDRAVDHLSSIRTGTRLMESHLKPDEGAEPIPMPMEESEGMQGAQAPEFGEMPDEGRDDMTTKGFDNPEDEAFLAAARGQIGDAEAEPQMEGDSFVLDHDPWEGNGGGAPINGEMEDDFEDDMGEEPVLVAPRRGKNGRFLSKEERAAYERGEPIDV
jgi:hypothetical protein